MSSDQPAHSNGYVFDAESGTETARLMHQDRLMTSAMGGIFPEPIDLSRVSTILDIGCGPGGWVLDVAREYPDKEIIGTDISNTTIQYAQARVQSQGLDNARFRLMDATQGLDFPDESFDLVNARLIQGFMAREAWPELLKECMRVTRPGGIIRLTETEWAISNSAALEQITEIFTRAMNKAGKSFSPYGRHIAITPMLERLEREAGYQNIKHMAHVVNHSAGSAAFEGFYQDYVIGFKTVQPFLVRVGATTPEEINQVYERMQMEMSKADFCSLWFILTVWGQKSL
jgi:ubiquinone/menaquinone biosynthesis C-methylase UbiE